MHIHFLANSSKIRKYIYKQNIPGTDLDFYFIVYEKIGTEFLCNIIDAEVHVSASLKNENQTFPLRKQKVYENT